MKRSVLLLTLIFILFGLLPVGGAAQKELSPKALEIAHELNCPVCEGQSVRDSNSQLARDMRDEIQVMLDEGMTEQEIKDYFAHPDRYGPGILREPPKEGFFMTLWWMPVIGVVVGALVLGTFVTQKRSRPGGGNRNDASKGEEGSTDQGDDLSEYEDRVLRDLNDSDTGWNRR